MESNSSEEDLQRIHRQFSNSGGQSEDEQSQAIRSARILKIIDKLNTDWNMNSIESRNYKEVFHTATYFFSQLTWLSQKKETLKDIYKEYMDVSQGRKPRSEQNCFESYFPDHFTTEDIMAERRYYLIFRILKNNRVFAKYSKIYLCYDPSSLPQNAFLLSWRNILFGLLLIGYYQVSNERPSQSDESSLLSFFKRHEDSRIRSPLAFVRFTPIYENLKRSGQTLIKPTEYVNIINFNYEFNNYNGQNFLAYFELMRNFREHFDTFRNQDNPFAKQFLPFHVNTSYVFKIFNFLPSAYSFMLCLMRILCPIEHDIHQFIALEDNSFPDFYEIFNDKYTFLGYMKAIFVELFNFSETEFDTHLKFPLSKDYDIAFRGK